jgi:hypothetical protein
VTVLLFETVLPLSKSIHKQSPVRLANNCFVRMSTRKQQSKDPKVCTLK